MGSAVPCDCQEQWTSNIAARGHIASFIHEASSPACAGEEGGIILLPQLGTLSRMQYNLYFQFPCVSCDMFLPVLKFIPFCGGVIWLLPERASFYSNRACLRVTQELIFSPVPFNSHQNTNVLLQRTKK